MKIESYPETHMRGTMSIEQDMEKGVIKDTDVGVQIARDGRIWICVNGCALIRFHPHNGTYLAIEGKLYSSQEKH